MSSQASKVRSSGGFTLVEVVMVLSILGFVTLSVGVGMLYAVDVYRQTRGSETVSAQGDAALHVIRRLADREGTAGLERRLRWDREREALFLDGSLLMEGVTDYAVHPSVSAFDGEGTLLEVVVRIRIGPSSVRTRECRIMVAREGGR